MLHAGVGTASIGQAHSILSVALSEAVRTGLLTDTPTTHARPPKHVTAKPRPLDAAQARALLAACRAPRAPSGPILAVILLLGLRPNEAVGLRWAYVDRTNGQLRIPGTKTTASAATMPLLPLVDSLLGDARPGHLPVFEGRYPGRPTSRQTVRRHLGELLDALGIDRPRIHDLRHSCGAARIRGRGHPRRPGRPAAQRRRDVRPQLPAPRPRPPRRPRPHRDRVRPGRHVLASRRGRRHGLGVEEVERHRSR